MTEFRTSGAPDGAQLAETNSEATLDELNATLADKSITAEQIVSIVHEPAHCDPVGILVKPSYRVIYRP